MRAKKVWAIVLSVAMTLTSFSVPAMADEIIDEPVVEAVEESLDEAADDYEISLEEIAEESEAISDEDASEVILNAEGDEGSTYYVATASDINKYLCTKNDKNPDTAYGKYLLSAGNHGKDVTLILTNNITLSANTIDFIPGDRFVHIDLNGHTIDTVDGKEVEIKLAEVTSGKYKGFPSLTIETSEYGSGNNNVYLKFIVEGNPTGNEDTAGSTEIKKQSLLKIGDGRNPLGFRGTVVNKGGIVNVLKEVYLQGANINNEAGSLNISGLAESSTTVSGNNIKLMNAMIYPSAKEVILGDGSLVSGSTKGIITTAGNVEIALDEKSYSNWTSIDVKKGTTTMTSGTILGNVNVAKDATFIMNGGRIENDKVFAPTATNYYGITAEDGANVVLNRGVVTGDDGAMLAGTKYNKDKESKGLKFIVNGVESETEDVDSEGEITNEYELLRAAKNGGKYKLAANIKLSKDVTVTEDLSISNKGSYSIDVDGKNIKIASGKTFTSEVNICGSNSNRTTAVIDATVGKFIDNGADIVAVSGNAIKVADITKVDEHVVLNGGMIVGSAGFDYYRYDCDEDKLPHSSTCDYTNAAIAGASKGYLDSAAVINNGVAVIRAEIEVANNGYVLMNKDYKEVALADLFTPNYYGVADAAGTAIIGSDRAEVEYNATSQKIVLKNTNANGKANVSYELNINGKNIAVARAIVEYTTATIDESLGEHYNATLISTSGKMNAYAKEYKIYFDMHLDSSEQDILNGITNLKPSYAIINAPKGNKFDYYLPRNYSKPGDANKVGYEIGYDTDKSLYYVSLDNSQIVAATNTTKLAVDGIDEFENLSISVVFTQGPTEDALFTVPMTKYKYNKLVPENKTNSEQKYTLEISQDAPKLTFKGDKDDKSKKKKEITINAAFDLNGEYKIDYKNLVGVEDSQQNIHPGYFTEDDILEISDKNIDVDYIWLRKKNGDINYTNGKFYYEGTAGTTKNSKEKDQDVKVAVVYKDYYGEFDLKIPVTIKSTFPKPELSASTFTVAKGNAVTNIPLNFISKEPDDLGAITYVEVINNNKIFSVDQSYDNLVTSTDGKEYKREGYKLNVAAFTGKKSIAGKIKVHFGTNIKAKNGAEYTKTYKITVKPVTKWSIKRKKAETLFLGSTASANAVITLSTDPSYFNGTLVATKMAVKAKADSNYKEGDLRVAVTGNKEITLYKDTDAAITGVSSVKISLNYLDANGKQMLAKDAVITASINSKKPGEPKKSEYTVDMSAQEVATKLYNNKTVEGDCTAAKMAKIVKYGNTNLCVASVSGNVVSGNNVADYFTVTEPEKGKSIKITPKLSALKTGMLAPRNTYELTINLKEQGSGKAAGSFKVNVRYENNPKKTAKEYKVSASIGGTAVLYSTAAGSTAKRTITTKKPFYGMKVKSVEINEDKVKAAIKDYFEVESVNLGQGFTARNTDGGKEYSDIQISFKDGKVPTKATKNGFKLVTGTFTVPVVVEYENGFCAYPNLKVTIK